MKMIVTGSEGFIGKALCQELKRRDVEVIGIDRKNGKDAASICDILKNGDIDCVFHLAAQTSVFNGNIPQIRKDNIDTFINVADACNRYHVKLVYASSSAAHPCNTTSMYGISKYFNEQYASFYCKDATGVRLHNVYGSLPRKRTLLWFLLNRGKVKLYNYGRNIRCFTYIDDAVQGLIYAYGSHKRLVNVANMQPITVKSFAEIVGSYKSIDIELVETTREHDNSEQVVDRYIFLVPLSYTSVENGIRKIFAGRKNQTPQNSKAEEG
ncbi:NAD-dependent epimerase/dehydratase family protein [Phocaeicola sp.]|uniref:NAD-dependent epimerase/dehydratase family protein n=1 Tax=Phocaeicola sp. TaxID=2773926 RepID=UPI003AB634E9